MFDYQNEIERRKEKFLPISNTDSYSQKKLGKTGMNLLSQILEEINEIRTLLDIALKVIVVYHASHNIISKREEEKQKELENIIQRQKKSSNPNHHIITKALKKKGELLTLNRDDLVKLKGTLETNMKLFREMNHEMINQGLPDILTGDFVEYKLNATKETILRIVAKASILIGITIDVAKIINAWDKKHQERVIKENTDKYLLSIENNLLGMHDWIIALQAIKRAILDNLEFLTRYIFDKELTIDEIKLELEKMRNK